MESIKRNIYTAHDSHSLISTSPSVSEITRDDMVVEVVDLLAPYAKGGKIGLFGGAGVGATPAALSAIWRIVHLGSCWCCIIRIFAHCGTPEP